MGDLSDVESLAYGGRQGRRAENDIEPLKQRWSASCYGPEQLASCADRVVHVAKHILVQLVGRGTVLQQNMADIFIKKEGAVYQEVDVRRLRGPDEQRFQQCPERRLVGE